MDRVLDAFWAVSGHDLPPVDVCLGASGFDAARSLEGVRALAPATLGRYGDPRGEADIREAIAQLLHRERGIDVSPGRVFVTEGASGALTSAFVALLQPGDEIILPKVYFPPYALLARMVGATCRYAELDEHLQMRADAVRRLVTPKTRAIVVNSPGNPLGTVLPRKDLEDLLALGVPIVADEVYGFLSSERATSVLELTDDHVAVGSFSKTYASPGLRIGYAVVPERLVDVMFAVRASLTVCASRPSQMLALELVAHHDEIVAAHRAYLDRNRALFKRQCELHRVKLLLSPFTGFFGLVDVSGIDGSSLDIALDVARSMNLALAPGSDFSDADPRFLRMNFSGPMSDIEAAVSRVRAYFELRLERGGPLASGAAHA